MGVFCGSKSLPTEYTGCAALFCVFWGASGVEDAFWLDLEHVARIELIAWVDHLEYPQSTNAFSLSDDRYVPFSH